MQKGSIIKIIFGVVTGLLLLYFYFTAEKKPTYNWYPNFKIESKDPYGCYLFYSLVKESFSGQNFTEMDDPPRKVLESYEGSDATYVFIGSQAYYSEADLTALANFVYAGNTAYVMLEDYPYEILNNMAVFSSIYFDTFYEEKANLEIGDSDPYSVSVEYIEDWEKAKYHWYYADSISDEQIQILGDFGNEKINYLKVSYGSGNLHLHLTPLTFTNFHLKNEDKLKYANKVLADFEDGPIFWDNFSHIPSEESELSESPLSFILSQESLRWAWYLLVSIGLVYLVFYTKRKQRVIPVINKVKNTSIDFVKTIGAMYYHQAAHLKIVQHQRQLFLTYINTHYGIKFNKEESFIKKVSLKSGLKEDQIDLILKEAKRLELLENITTKDLIAYNELTENFYRNCK